MLLRPDEPATIEAIEPEGPPGESAPFNVRGIFYLVES